MIRKVLSGQINKESKFILDPDPRGEVIPVYATPTYQGSYTSQQGQLPLARLYMGDIVRYRGGVIEFEVVGYHASFEKYTLQRCENPEGTQAFRSYNVPRENLELVKMGNSKPFGV